MLVVLLLVRPVVSRSLLSLADHATCSVPSADTGNPQFLRSLSCGQFTSAVLMSYLSIVQYQSLLYCSVLGILHLLFIWSVRQYQAIFVAEILHVSDRSSRLSWLLVFFDIGSLAYLAFKAYEDGHDLIRYKLPFIGDFADRWVEEE